MALPGHYFRRRGNGALVFRVERDDRLGRMDMRPIATVNLATGAHSARGQTDMTAEDEAAIAAWIAVERDREPGPRERGLKGIGRLADWVQREATDDEIAENADDILLALHDLRQAIVKRRAPR